MPSRQASVVEKELILLHALDIAGDGIPHTPPPLRRSTIVPGDATSPLLPSPLPSPPAAIRSPFLFNPESNRRYADRRASLQAEYAAASTPNANKRLSLANFSTSPPTDSSSSVIPLRRYSVVPRATTPTSPRESIRSSASLTPSSRPPVFHPKPLVLTPQRSIVAPLTAAPHPTSSVNSSPSRKRLSDQYSFGTGSAHSRRSSLNASVGRPISPFNGRASPLGYYSTTAPSRRRSMGYIENASATAGRNSNRDSVGSSSQGHGGPPSSNRWNEGRHRTLSEETGQTRTTGGETASRRTTGESPDSSVSGGWSDEREKERAASGGTTEEGSPALNEKEWESEYQRKTAGTPLGVLEEGKTIERWDEEGHAFKRRTVINEDGEEAANEENVMGLEGDRGHRTPTPVIELQVPSPDRAQSSTSILEPLVNGHGLAALHSDAESEPPSPPPTIPLPSPPSPSPSPQKVTSPMVTSPAPTTKSPRVRRTKVKYDQYWNGEASLANSSPSTNGTDSPSFPLSPVVQQAVQARSILAADAARADPSQRAESPKSQVFSSAPSTPLIVSPAPSTEPAPAHNPPPREYQPIVIKSRSARTGSLKASSAGSLRAAQAGAGSRRGLRLAEVAVAPVSHEPQPVRPPRPSVSPPAVNGHSRSFSFNRQERLNSRGRDEGRSTSTEKLSGLAIWPPPDDGHTKTLVGGRRLSAPDSDSSNPPSPLLYYGDDDPARRGLASKRPTPTTPATAYGYLPRRPINLEPRDPRAHIAGPDSYLEILLTTEPPPKDSPGPVRRDTFDSMDRSSDSHMRWSTYSSSSQGTSLTPNAHPTGSAQASPSKSFSKRFFSFGSKSKTSRPTSMALPPTSRPIHIPAQPRPISIAPRLPRPASVASSRAVSTRSGASSGFLPRHAPLSPLWDQPAQMANSDYAPSNASSSGREDVRGGRGNGYEPRRGPINDDVEEELADWQSHRLSTSSSIGSELGRAPPRAYQLPPGLAGSGKIDTLGQDPHSIPAKIRQSRRKSSRPDLQTIPSSSLIVPRVPPSPTSSAASRSTYHGDNHSARSRQGSFETGASLGRRPSGSERSTDGEGPPTPGKEGFIDFGSKRPSSRESRLYERNSAVYGARDVLRSQVVER